MVQSKGQFEGRWVYLVLLTATKEYLLLVLESFSLLANDTIGQIIRLVYICGKSDRHQLLPVFLLEVAQICRVRFLLFLVNRWVVTHCRH